ncbi:MAG: hypothetical protein J1F39_03095, partial [Clostridiales bacterium]|nr:hypothetical protein [Clostridiales bacterium]
MEKIVHKRSILAILIVAVMACIAAISVIFALPALADETETVKDPIAIIHLGKSGMDKGIEHYEKDFEKGWTQYLKKAKEAYAADNTAYVKFVLEADWEAVDGSFGLTEDYYNAGRLFIPAATNITIDLNGHNIDRKLDSPTPDGHVLYVKGNLTVTDSKKIGRITGGYNNTTESVEVDNVASSSAEYTKVSRSMVFGGGVLVDGGMFDLSGGNLVDNQVQVTALPGATTRIIMGIGAAVINGGTFNMHGGTIANHSSEETAISIYGGGVAVFKSGVFNMYGGEIHDNKATNGGGVACYDVDGLAINIAGGSIHHNGAVGSVATAGGGGVCAFWKGDVKISNDGEINNNYANREGGAVYMLGYAGVSTLTIDGGSLHDNVVASTGNTVDGGAVTVRRYSASKLVDGVYVNANMTAGEIYNNMVVVSNKDVRKAGAAQATYYEGKGGALNVFIATFTLDGGKIHDNHVYALRSDNPEYDGVENPVDDATQENIDLIYKGQFDTSKFVNANSGHGGAAFVSYWGTSDGYHSAAGTLIMNGGEVYNNTATSGGGFNLQGEFKMYGGEIYGNKALHGGGVYLTSYARVFLSGSPVVRDNFSNASEDDDPSDLEVSASDNRTPQIDGAFTDDANVHLYTTETMIDNGRTVAKGYGVNNSMYVAVTGENKDKAPDTYTDKDGVLVYVNPHKYFTGDTVISAGTAAPYVLNENDKTEQHFVVISKSENDATHVGGVAVIPSAIVYTVHLQNEQGEEKTETFTIGDNTVTDDTVYNYMTTTYGDEYFPVKITADFKINQYVDGTKDFVRDEVGNRLLADKHYEMQIPHEKGQPDAGVYTFEVRITPEKGETGRDNNTKSRILGNIKAVYTAFHVVVKAQDFDDSSVSNGLNIKPVADGEDGGLLDEDGNLYYVYDGSAHLPKAVVTLGEGEDAVTLEEGKDYTITYDRQVNAGYAILTINFIGNYQGSASVTYKIVASTSTDKETDVSWEYFNGNTWQTIDGNVLASYFAYNGTDQSVNIRAKLSGTGDSYVDGQTIYSETVPVYNGEGKPIDEKRNTSMSLEFAVGDNISEDGFVNGGTYTVTVKGESNYPLKEENHILTGLVMKSIEINVPATDYAGYLDDDQSDSANKLWQLQIGLDGDEDVKYTDLISDAVYIDEDVTDENGDHVVNGTSTAAEGAKYARYRGVPLSIVINGAYNLKTYGKTLAELMALGDVTVESTQTNASAGFNEDGEYGFVGMSGKVSKIKTVVTIAFNPSNYVVKDNSVFVEGNKIVIEKEWWIVTMSNGLRTDDGEEIRGSKLGDWTFGDPDDLKGEFFRAEHGDTVIYSYYYAGTDVLVDNGQFALVYSDDTSFAIRQFYGVMMVGNDLAPDTSNPIAGEGYVFNFNYTLKAGDYRLEVTVPANEPLSGEHNHWWQKNEKADDIGVRYYKFTHTFTFTVKQYEIAEDDLVNGIIKVEFPEDNATEYNGYNNNYVSPTITLFDTKVLEENIDYTLSSDAVNVGWATLKFTGKDSVKGSFELEDAFYIKKATPIWTIVPNPGSWKYSSFDRNVNRLRARPSVKLDNAEDMWFEITYDENGNNPVDGLGKFFIDDDFRVTAEIEKLLKLLSAGNYYLVAHVEEKETGNYYGISTNPIQFTVHQETNTWDVTPSVNAWTEGEFTKTEDHILYSATFGEAHVIIYDSKGNIVYDNFDQIDRLFKAKAGTYTLTAEVAGSANYSKLELYTVVFSIFEKPGLPWWVTLVVSVGAILLIALVLVILWKKGVFQILTEKLVVSIRTRATVEATIAS